MRIAFLCLALLLATPAAAQQRQQALPDLPRWDMRAHCEQSNRILATESAFMLNACIRQEESAFSMISRDWPDLSGPIRRTCLEQQRVLRMTSYFMLNACVQQELGATRELQQRR